MAESLTSEAEPMRSDGAPLLPDDGGQGGPPADIFDVLIHVLLITLIVASPLAMGAVAPWARSAVFSVSLALLLLWGLQAALRGQLRIVRSWIWLFVAAFFAIALVQIIPLPRGALGVISPATIETYGRVLPEDASARATISLFPYGAHAEIYRLAALVMVFFVVAHNVRTRWQAATILLAVVAVGLFESLYGFGEQFSGSRRIFWNLRDAHLEAVTGTFRNKNHFAGLLEMALPATLGLVLALIPRRLHLGNARSLVIARLASPGIQYLLILCLAALIMGVGILFSLSRAGILCAALSMIALALCLALSAAFRKYTLLLFALLAGIILFAAVVGTEIVAQRVEDVVSGRSASWADRMNLSRSGLVHLRTFPLLGTGLGSFRYAFERFQSSRFGDRVGDFLHNDWLQGFCEMGIAGGSIVVAAVLIFLWSTGRVAFSRRDPFCRWTSLGALLGVGAMLFHSFFDFNLYRITSNGIMFAALAGLAFAASRMPSGRKGSQDRRKFVTIPLGPFPLRIMLAAIFVCAAVLVSLRPASAGLADISFNRFLATSKIKPPDKYFFLPVSEDRSESAEEMLSRAQMLDPENPRYHHYGALSFFVKAEKLVTEKASESARQLLGPDIAAADPQAFERVVEALARNVRSRPSSERAHLLRQAEEEMRAALKQLPISADYQMCMGQILISRAEAEGPAAESACGNPENPVSYAERALWLAPSKPRMLFNAGKILLQQSEKPQDEAKRGLALEYFRRAILVDPSYVDSIYPLVQAVQGSISALSDVTPRTLRAHNRLAQVLWDSGEWDALLSCLDTMEELSERQVVADQVSPWTLNVSSPGSPGDAEAPLDFSELPSSLAYDAEALLKQKISIAQRRAAIFGLLGRPQERWNAVGHYRELLRVKLNDELLEAQEKQARRQYEPAMSVCRRILQQDWANPDALFTAAHVAHTTGQSSVEPYWDGALDHLYRLVICNEALTAESLDRARAIIELINPKTDSDKIAAEFILGAGAILAGRAEEGVAKLRLLASRNDEAAGIWRQRHLVWYYLGLGYERLGEKRQAAEAYRRVTDIVPTHLQALLRLRDIGDGDDSISQQIAALTPDVQLNVNFGGRITLLGYSLSQEKVPLRVAGITLEQDAWFMTYYWQIHERMYPDYHPSVHFCDENWQTLFRGDHRIRGSKTAYPLEFPRCGEVVAYKQPIPDPTGARYLRIAIATATPPPLQPYRLSYDAGYPLYSAKVQLCASQIIR